MLGAASSNQRLVNMPRGSNGVNLSLDQLERILNQRRRELSRLVRRRSTAQRRLDDIDDRIRRLGGGTSVRASVGRRARNDKSLVEVIHGVLQKAGRPMRVSAIAEAANSAGYRSNSANFRGIVNQMLIKDSRFASQSRGFYQLKK
jgi:HB1, ASXL, restriction endonuclease HTH domain